VPEQIVHRAACGRIERQIGVLAVAHEQPLAFQRPADPLGDPPHERIELFLQHFVGQQRSRLGHAPRATARAYRPHLAAERDELLGMTRIALDPKKSVLEAPAAEVGLECPLNVFRQRPFSRLARGDKCRVMHLDEPIAQRPLGPVARIARRIDERRRLP
jgi:hypothetical protein